MHTPPNRRVVAVAYDRLCTFEFGVASELFGLPRPELGVDWYSFEVVRTDPGPLRLLGDVTLDASADLSRIETAGTIVLPGWRDIDERPPETLLAALRTAHANGARLMSICSGVFILAAAGLLDGRTATTHWRYTARLAAMYPAINVRPDVLYVDSGQILTSAGSAAGIDLGIHLIRRDYGAEIANRVARRLVVSPHRDGGQAQFIVDAVATDAGAPLAPLLEWAIANLQQPLSIDDLAREASTSPRTLARRFRDDYGTTPHRWLIMQRVALAQRLLETTNAGIDEVAAQTGFGSAATLRHHFARIAGTSPSAYRRRFRIDTTAN